MQIFQDGAFIQLSIKELFELIGKDRKQTVIEILDSIEKSKEYLTASEVSKLLHMSPDRVRDIFKERYPQHIERHGKLIYINKQFVLSLVENKKKGATDEEQPNVDHIERKPEPSGKSQTRPAYRTKQKDVNP